MGSQGLAVVVAIIFYAISRSIIYYYCFPRTELVPAYVRLLRDNEAEVRIAAAGKVTKFCRILSPDLAIQHILPCVKVCMTVCFNFYLINVVLR